LKTRANLAPTASGLIHTLRSFEKSKYFQMNLTTTKFIVLFLGINFCIHAQTYPDHFGTGNDVGVMVTSSPEQGTNEASHTLNGTGLFPDMVGASRFLAQTQLGYKEADIQNVISLGIDAWLDQQISMPITVDYEQTYRNIHDDIISMMNASLGAADSARRDEHIPFVFYQKAFTDDDGLRQKIAFALSQIFVVSINGTIGDRGFGLSSYYDVLYNGAFGNFRDLLFNVSSHPIMGIYLSHFKNEKANPVEGTLPDENYAREIMQLFTIGLFELNNDGSLKLDANGAPIPTYDIEDVQEMAKVFTGFSGGDWDYVSHTQYTPGDPLLFQKNFNHYDLTVPMYMHDDHHDTGTKILPDGTIIPAGQTGMQDVNMAIDWLFNHPNVGPFIGYRLIQQLVKSNPTPEYVNRVATAFSNDGNGVRGNMEAVVRAILTDPEARDCAFITAPRAGKLLQPIERMMNLFYALNISTPSGRYWFRDYGEIYDKVEQSYLYSPTVFNFFSPFFADGEFVAPNDMVSPEFQLLHSTSSIHYLNMAEDMIKVRPFKNKTGINDNPNNPRVVNNSPDNPTLDFTPLTTLFAESGLTALIDHLDLYLCRGQLGTSTKAHIENNIAQNLANGTNMSDLEVVEDVLYYIMISPSYVILK